jgi:hypothetical protein
MHDREFEKKVQQQMQELRLAPGSEVWMRVREDLRKKKRRRPVIIWLLFAGLLLGGSAWLLYGIQDNNNGQATAVTKPAATTSTKDATSSTKTISPVTKPATATPDPAGTGTTTTITAASETSLPAPRKQRTAPVIKQITNPVTKKKEQPVLYEDEDKTGMIPVETLVPEDPSLRYANVSMEFYQPAIDIIIAPPAAPPGSTTPPKTTPGKQPNWQWGVQAGGGVSDMAMQLFEGNTRVADFAYNSGGGSVSGPPIGSGNIPRASSVSSGAAFQLGGFVSKRIGRKLRLKAGLSYEYYSNNIIVGERVPSQRVVNQGTADSVMVGEYYKATGSNKYTNSYHFASLPVSVQWQIGNHAKRNIVWENGITLSRMLHTNALVYDGVGGAYYTDNSVFNKMQWSLSTSLLFSIKSKSNIQFFAGPHFQYGLSSLVKNDDKHVRYAGLKLAVGFNKK